MSKFKILWIDDQKKKCEKDWKSVKRIIEEKGFEAEIIVEDDITMDSLHQETGTLHSKIRARDIDLFVIDYHLKNDIFGNDVVSEIRKNNDIYTDIVFYSSDSKSLIEVVKNSYDESSICDYFDGVYVAPLGDEFVEKIGQIINKIIKSWYNVHSIRGIVLAKASKFEQMVAMIINEHYKETLQTIIEKLISKGQRVCDATYDRWEKVKSSDDPIPLILNDPIGFNWAVKKMILEELVAQNIVALSTINEINNIFELRNRFAHNPMHIDNGKIIVSTSKGIFEYDEEDIEDVRNKLTIIENDFNRILTPSSAKDIIPNIEDDLNLLHS